MTRPLLIGMVVGFPVAVAAAAWWPSNRTFALGTLSLGIAAAGPTLRGGAAQ